MEVLRGSEDAQDVGKVTKFNGKDKLSFWAGEECNTIQGTDSTIFPPLQKKEDDIVFFAGDLCRSLRLTYTGEDVELKGVRGGRHDTSFAILANDTASRCWCPKSGCLERGALDMSNCLGVPMIFTSPHFYEGSETYLNRIEGLNPNKEDHGIYMDMEPITGAIFDVRLRIQFNMFVYDMKKVQVTRNLTTKPFLHPLFWLQSSVDITEELLEPIKMLYTVLKVAKIIKYIMLIGGFAIMGFGGFLVFLANQNKVKDVVQNTVRKMDFNGHSSEHKMDPNDPSSKY
uniref:Sensory neuron membrane protein 1 n=1 Tax=Cacopsylla melanoneura TaxID=428564 RepID=A0A8D8Z9T4_9HEMI